MHIRFFQDKPNQDLVDSVLIDFSSMRVTSMIFALPTAMLAMMREMPRLPESENSDFEANEEHRKALNKVIQLGQLLEEVMRLVMTHKTIDPGFRMMENSYMEASHAFFELQKHKNARIAITHRDLGENFGSRTGFQEHDYALFSREIAVWIENIYTLREKAEARPIEQARREGLGI